MRKTGTGFTTQLTNSWKCWKTKKKPQKCGFIYLGSPNIAPRYAINKIKKISLGRFFKIFLIVYSRIRHAQLGLLWRIRLGHFSKIKKSGKTRFVYFGSPNIAPWQPITKPRRKNSIKHIRFCRFANCLSAYSPCATGVALAHPVGAF